MRVVIPRSPLRDLGLVCPACGADVVLRRPRESGPAFQPFYGCSRYPRCQTSISLHMAGEIVSGERENDDPSDLTEPERPHGAVVTDEHVHSWKPMPLEMGRFLCDCGVTGYRKEYGELRGQVMQHKQTKKVKGAVTHVGNPNLDNGNARRGKRGPGGW